MWTLAILLLLAGAVAANENGWESDKEYTYKIKSRTMVTLRPSDNHYTGVLMKGSLTVQPKDSDNLLAKLTKTKLSRIHTKLLGGWDSEIPESQMTFEEFPMTGKPFEIKMKHGVVRDLVVDKDVPTWEVNVLKSIVSQFQVDTQGENRIKSKHNHGPEGEQPFAMFKTMEDSVSGKCEVLYDISPLPGKIWSENSELVLKPELVGDKHLIKIVKTKNYTNCEQRMSFHYGMTDNSHSNSENGESGKFLSKSSVSRIVISGDLKSLTIQFAETTNKMILTPEKRSRDKNGMVASRMRLSLSQVESVSERLSMPPNPHSTGNLVYNFNSPFSGPERRRSSRPNISPSSRPDSSSSSSEESKNKNKMNSGGKFKTGEDSSSSSSSSSSLSTSNSIASREDREFWQPKPSLLEAPENPLLPYFIGNKGNSIQMSGSIDPVRKTKELSKEIGRDLKNPSDMQKEETLEKFLMLIRLIRTMSKRQLEEAEKDLFEPSSRTNSDDESSFRRNSWAAFRDAVAEAGTGPALVVIKNMIETRKIKNMEAAQVIASASKSAMTPTPEFVETFFKLMTMPETRSQPHLNDSAILAFADLVRNAIVDKRNSHNFYPVHSFGRMFSKQNSDLFKAYIPLLAQELKTAMKEGNSLKIQTFIVALGKIAHPKVLGVFEPFLEGKEPSSKYQRLLMVLSMFDMTKTYPKVARSVAYKIYANTGESYEIRCAAVRIVMKTNPSASMLQRMAETTNYDDSKHVNSAVKSAIESASELKNYNHRELANNARAARSLLTKEKFGPQFSRNFIKEFLLKEMKVNMQSSFIGSKDSLMPKEWYFSLKRSLGGLQMPVTEVGSMVSSVNDMLSYLEKKLRKSASEWNSEERDFDKERSNYSADKIAQMLRIEADGPNQIEGNARFDSKGFSLFIPFDNHTLDRLPDMHKQISESLREGRDFNLNKFSSDEKILSFPTETGFPFIYSWRMPSLIKIEGRAKLRTDPVSVENFKELRKVDASSEVRMVFSMKIQERIGFLTPFEHKHYIAGEDKNFQFFLPIRVEAEVNTEKKEVKVKVEPLERKESYKLLQFSCMPYISEHNILSMKPVLQGSKNTRIIGKGETKKDTKDFLNLTGMKTTFTMESEFEEKSGEKKHRSQPSFSSFLSSFFKSSSSFKKMSIKVTPTSDNSESSIKFKLSYDSKRKSNSDGDGSNGSGEFSDKAKAPLPSNKEPNSENRRNQFLRDVSKGISSAKTSVVDMSLEVTGRQPISFTLTAAVARSNVDKKYRSLFYINTQEDRHVNFEVCAALETKSPNAPELDFDEIMKFDLTEEFDADIHYGKDCSSGAKIRVEGTRKQSEEYKKEISESEEAKEVERLKSGDLKMTNAYQKLMQKASELDETEMTVEFNDKASTAKQNSMLLLDLAADSMGQVADIKRLYPKNANQNKIDFKIKTTLKNGAFVSIYAPNMDVKMRNVFFEDMVDSSKESSQSSKSSDEDDFESLSNTESFCFMGKKLVDTFDNNVFPYEFGKCWHVVMTTFPRGDPDRLNHERSIPKDMKTTILTRETEDGKKEVKIVLGEKEIRLNKPGSRMEVTVDGQRVPTSKRKSFEQKSNKRDLEGHHLNKIEIFELEDGSVKVTSETNGVEVVFGGRRMKITADDKYRNSVRGICGNFDGEAYNDQKTPRNCQLKNPKEFAASWALTRDKCEGPAQKYAENAKRAHCFQDKNRLSNVINDEEAGRGRGPSTWGHHNEESKKSSRCTTHRTKVIRNDFQTCFSLRPLPSCSRDCKLSNTKEKNVDMHCVKNSNASEKLAQRIEDGANPDLSQKSVTRTIKMDVPVSCQAA